MDIKNYFLDVQLCHNIVYAQLSRENMSVDICKYYAGEEGGNSPVRDTLSANIKQLQKYRHPWMNSVFVVFLVG